jgi:hypothetical protein
MGFIYKSRASALEQPDERPDACDTAPMGEMILAHPWDPTFWGSIGQWASAIGTSSAAIAAAGYYIYDKYSERRKQALLVGVTVQEFDALPEEGPGATGSMHIRIINNSDAPVDDVTAVLQKKPFEDLVLHSDRTFSTSELPQLKKDWYNLPKARVVHVTPGRLEAHKEHTQVFENTRMGRVYRLRLSFVDANSYPWVITVQNADYARQRHRLQRIRSYRSLGEFFAAYEDDYTRPSLSYRFFSFGHRFFIKTWLRQNSRTKKKR